MTDLPEKELPLQKKYDPIPPGIFKTETWNDGVTPKSYLNARATSRVIKEAAVTFRISEYHLFTLMGIYDKATGYHWTSGMKRPSSMYLTRLAKLFLIHFGDGKPLIGIEFINWETGEIEFRSFNNKDGKRHRNNLPNGRPALPQGNSRPSPLTTFVRSQR